MKGQKKIFLVLISFSFLVSLLGLYNSALRPALPLKMIQSNQGIRVTFPSEDQPAVKLSDRTLQQVDGFPVKHVHQVEELIERKRIGNSVALTFRNGTTHNLTLIPRYSLWQLLINFLLGIFFFSLGGLVWYRARQSEDRLFSLSAFLFGYIIMMNWGGIQLPEAISLPLVCLYFISYPLSFLTFLRFSYYFPSSTLSPKGLKFRTRLILLIGVVFSFLLIVFFLRKSFWFSLVTVNQYYVLYRIFRFFILATLILAFFNMIRNWIRQPDLENRRKIQWVLWGVFWGSFPFIFLWNVPQIFGFSPLIPEWIANLAILFIPTTVAIAILRHRLFDIEIVISRSVVYSIVLLSLIGVYLLSASGFSLLLMNQFSLNSPIASVMAALLVALLFHPLKTRVQQHVDRRFYRIKYDRFQVLKSFLSQLENLNEQREVLNKLQTVFQRAVPVQKQEVILLSETLSDREMSKDRDAFVRWWEAYSFQEEEKIFTSPAQRKKIESGLTIHTAPLPKPYVLFLPIAPGLGWAIGEKRAGTRFWQEDLDLARQMASATATQLEKIRYLRNYIRESLEREKAQQLSEWKSMLVAEVAHDLRSPLNTILWKLKNLQSSLSSGTENLQNATVAIQRQVQRLQNLIQSLLSFSSIERGQLQLNRMPLSIQQMVQEVLDCLQEAIARKGLTIRQEVPESLTLRTDPVFFQEILMNILHNAVKFSPDGKSIWIRARQLTRPEGGEVEIQVQDQAGGMTREQIAAAFEPFQPKSGKTATGGFHLGLYIVKQFTELLKGKVEITSQPGTGTTVSLHFPLQKVNGSERKDNP